MYNSNIEYVKSIEKFSNKIKETGTYPNGTNFAFVEKTIDTKLLVEALKYPNCPKELTLEFFGVNKQSVENLALTLEAYNKIVPDKLTLAFVEADMDENVAEKLKKATEKNPSIVGIEFNDSAHTLVSQNLKNDINGNCNKNNMDNRNLQKERVHFYNPENENHSSIDSSKQNSDSLRNIHFGFS